MIRVLLLLRLRLPAPRCPLSACLVPFVWCVCVIVIAVRVLSGAAAAPATPAATLGTHALVPLHAWYTAAGCARQGPLRMRTFCWRVCALSDMLTG